MRKKFLFLFVLFLVVTFLFPVFSPSLVAKPINDNPDDDIWNDGPWEDPSNRPDFFLGNTEEFDIQNVFIDGKPLNPSVYFFTIHKELFVPVRIVTYALGGKVYWEPAKRKVYINGKELNTTRIILGTNCYVPLRSLAVVFKAEVAYDTKNKSAAIWSKHPAELGYPMERWYLGTSDYYSRLSLKTEAEIKNSQVDKMRSKLREWGVVGVELMTDQAVIETYEKHKKYHDDKFINLPSEETPESPEAPPPVGPAPTPPPPVPGTPEVPPPPGTPQVGPAPPVTTPPSSSPTPGGADPFNFGF